MKKAFTYYWDLLIDNYNNNRIRYYVYFVMLTLLVILSFFINIRYILALVMVGAFYLFFKLLSRNDEKVEGNVEYSAENEREEKTKEIGGYFINDPRDNEK